MAKDKKIKEQTADEKQSANEKQSVTEKKVTLYWVHPVCCENEFMPVKIYGFLATINRDGFYEAAVPARIAKLELKRSAREKFMNAKGYKAFMADIKAQKTAEQNTADDNDESTLED